MVMLKVRPKRKHNLSFAPLFGPGLVNTPKECSQLIPSFQLMLSLLSPFVAEPPYLSSLALPLNRIDDAVGPSAKVSTRKKVSNLTGSRQICICHSKMGSFCLLTFVDDEEGDKNQLDVFSILPVIYILLPSAGVFILYFKSCHILYFSSFLPYFVFSILPVMAIIRSIATWWGVVRRLTWHNQTSAPNSVLL